jgi:hypothetical protein
MFDARNAPLHVRGGPQNREDVSAGQGRGGGALKIASRISERMRPRPGKRSRARVVPPWVEVGRPVAPGLRLVQRSAAICTSVRAKCAEGDAVGGFLNCVTLGHQTIRHLRNAAKEDVRQSNHAVTTAHAATCTAPVPTPGHRRWSAPSRWRYPPRCHSTPICSPQPLRIFTTRSPLLERGRARRHGPRRRSSSSPRYSVRRELRQGSSPVTARRRTSVLALQATRNATHNPMMMHAAPGARGGSWRSRGRRAGVKTSR